MTTIFEAPVFYQTALLYYKFASQPVLNPSVALLLTSIVTVRRMISLPDLSSCPGAIGWIVYVM